MSVIVCLERNYCLKMKTGFVLWFVVSVCFISQGGYGSAISGQLYSSLVYMDNLFLFDQMVGSLFAFLPTPTQEVTRYLEFYSWLTVDASRFGGRILDKNITGNPLHIFAVIKRLVLYWPSIRITLNSVVNKGMKCVDVYSECYSWKLLGECHRNPTFMMVNCQKSCGQCPQSGLIAGVAKLTEAEKTTVLPSQNDLRGAAMALARLQRIYRMSIWNMANGRIYKTSTSVELTVYDCMMIANESYHSGEYSSAWQWYDYARSTTSDLDLRQHIKIMMDGVAHQHDALQPKDVYSQPQFFPALLVNVPKQIPRDTNFAKLCRGENFLSPDEMGQLHCHISHRGSSYLILQPVEYEQMHYDPPMYLFYNIIYPKEIEILKQMAVPKFERSSIVKPSGSATSERRVSQTAWLDNTTHPVLTTIANRISSITGLHVFEGPLSNRAGESLQVLSYGVGGHYDQHVDIFYKYLPHDQWNQSVSPKEEFIPGDRLATMMFYLSDVEVGGRTAFPKAGVSVTPVKGAAILWYNVKRNGEGNLKSRHGGCPVLLGHKWVANKWIREHANFLRRPCSLNPDD